MNIIGSRNPQHESIYLALQQSPLPALRQMLTDDIVLKTCRDVGYSFRRRRYGPVVTVLHFLAAAIQRECSFAANWQDLWAGLPVDDELFLAPFSSSALSQARSRLPRELMDALFDRFRGLPPQGPSTWRGFRLLALDATSVSMPDEPQLAGHFGRHKARHTVVRFPLATCCMLLSVGTSCVIDYRFGPYDPGELKTARPLLDRIGPGDLALADRHYAGTPTLAHLYRRGADFLMRKHARLIVEKLPVIRRLGKNDFITEIPMNKAARRADPSLPDTVRVRLCRARIKLPTGRILTDWFVTSLMDAKAYRPAALARLYHLRWRIETTYMEFKQWFHADILRSKTVDNIYKEFAGRALAYQLVRRLMCEAADRHRKPPTRLSFLNATRWIVAYSARMSAAPPERLPRLYRNLLSAIASTTIDVRDGRIEPRAIVRDPKHYPILKIPRAQWRSNFLGEVTLCLN